MYSTHTSVYIYTYRNIIHIIFFSKKCLIRYCIKMYANEQNSHILVHIYFYSQQSEPPALSHHSNAVTEGVCVCMCVAMRDMPSSFLQLFGVAPEVNVLWLSIMSHAIFAQYILLFSTTCSTHSNGLFLHFILHMNAYHISIHKTHSFWYHLQCLVPY